MIVFRRKLIVRIEDLFYDGTDRNKWDVRHTETASSFKFNDKESKTYILNIFQDSIEIRILTTHEGYVLLKSWDGLTSQEEHDSFVDYVKPIIFTRSISFKNFYEKSYDNK